MTSTSPRRASILRGLECPAAVLRAKIALRGLPVGATLLLECTDPLTVIDVPHFARADGP